jgi:rhamnosyltransferase
MLPVSVVIRTLNEAPQLRRLIMALQSQSLRPTELIVVDNESTDSTAQVAEVWATKVVTIPFEEFSYPRSLNAGMGIASCPVVVSLPAHAVPMRRDWLESAVRHFDRTAVAGVYSAVRPNVGAGLFERMMYNWTWCTKRKGSPYDIKEAALGTFSATCHAARRSTWMEHPFDEQYGMGGEDVEWAAWAMTQGKAIVYDHRFTVRHSHGLNAWQLYKQIKEWQAMLEPQPFDRRNIRYRRRDETPST